MAQAANVNPRDILAQNDALRQNLLMKSVDVWQQVATASVAAPGSSQNVITFQPRYVGLTKGFLLKCVGTLTNTNGKGDGSAATRTSFGPANFLSNVTVTDLSNYQRINTTGWHLNFLSTAKRRVVFGAAYTLNGMPVDYDNNYSSLIQQGSSLNSAATETVTMYYYIPLAYSDVDLRGAIWTNAVQSTMYIACTVNPSPGATSGDPVFQMSTGNTCTLTDVTLTLYQNYLDQVPRDPKTGAPMLPPIDLSYAYLLNSTSQTGMSENVQFGINYSNYREFYSTFAIYDQAGGTLNPATDITSWQIQAANFYSFYNLDPLAHLFRVRNQVGIDYPAAVYYFDHRVRPINTIQFGNVQLVLTASTVTSAATAVYLGYESMAQTNLIAQAQSLPS